MELIYCCILLVFHWEIIYSRHGFARKIREHPKMSPNSDHSASVTLSIKGHASCPYQNAKARNQCSLNYFVVGILFFCVWPTSSRAVPSIIQRWKRQEPGSKIYWHSNRNNMFTQNWMDELMWIINHHLACYLHLTGRVSQALGGSPAFQLDLRPEIPAVIFGHRVSGLGSHTESWRRHESWNMKSIEIKDTHAHAHRTAKVCMHPCGRYQSRPEPNGIFWPIAAWIAVSHARPTHELPAENFRAKT